MTEDKGRFGPFVDPNQASLRDVLVRLEAHPRVTASRRTRVRSAANTLSRILDRPLEEIPAHMRWLTESFRHLKRSGLAPKTVANTKSELRYAVRIALGRQARSAMPKLSGEWARLFEALHGSPLQWQLSRIIRYLARTGVAPGQVTDEHAAAYRRDLEASQEVDQPYSRWRAAIRAWNRAAQDVSSWPSRTLRLPPQRRRRWTLTEAEFPASFREDVEACLGRMARRDPLGQTGPRRELRPQTLKLRRHQYCKLASAAVFAGTPIESMTSLARLIEVPTFTKAVQHLLDRRDGEPSEALHGLVGAMVAVARHHVGVDEDHLDALRIVHANVEVETEGFRERTRRRLAEFDDDRNTARLVHLPGYLLQLARNPAPPRRLTPVLAQMAIAVEILLFTALRVGNLAALNLPRHVRRVVIDGENWLIVTFPRSETKNRRTISHPIDPDSLALIDAALALYEQPDGHVFPGRNGPKSGTFLSKQIKDTIREYAGLDMNPHAFRALLGVFHMRRHPGAFEDVRVMLHDRDGQTVREHYTVYADRHAIRHVQESILAARNAVPNPYLKPKGRSRRRRLAARGRRLNGSGRPDLRRKQ
jgi:integrase